MSIMEEWELHLETEAILDVQQYALIVFKPFSDRFVKASSFSKCVRRVHCGPDFGLNGWGKCLTFFLVFVRKVMLLEL